MENEKALKNMIDKDNLIGIAILIDSLQMLSGDLLQDYFEKLKPKTSEYDKMLMVYDFDRFKAYMNLLFNTICDINSEFHKLDIKI